jgi:hypothetical protein
MTAFTKKLIKIDPEHRAGCVAFQILQNWPIPGNRTSHYYLG